MVMASEMHDGAWTGTVDAVAGRARGSVNDVVSAGMETAKMKASAKGIWNKLENVWKEDGVNQNSMASAGMRGATTVGWDVGYDGGFGTTYARDSGAAGRD